MTHYYVAFAAVLETSGPRKGFRNEHQMFTVRAETEAAAKALVSERLHMLYPGQTLEIDIATPLGYDDEPSHPGDNP